MLYSIPVSDLDEFNALPQKVADKIRRLLQLFRQAAGLMEGGMSQARALQAVSKKAEGQTYGTLKRYFPAYRKSGNWRVLLDDRFEAAPQVNQDFREWCQKLALDNKRKTLPAWRAALRHLAAGDRIPGLGTWQECWRKENPGQPLPDACPYSVDTTQPKRLSQTSFYRFSKVSRTVKAINRMGTAAGRGELAGLIGFDTSQLMPFELLTFDDVRTDWRIFDPLTGQVVELWLLVAMDVATRVVINFACRPRRKRPDGTHEGICRRDMQHLIAGILQRFGMPRGQTMTLLVENASAAITVEFEAVLHEVSGGRILVRRTPMLAGNPWQDGWGEDAKGNPRAKGWLESAFNLLHNEGGNIKGQIGSDYSKKSQSIEPAAKYTEQLAKKASGVLTLTDRVLYGKPFEDLRQARHDLEEIFVRMSARRKHSITGFDLVREWKWKPQPNWNAWDEMPNLPIEAMAQIECRELPESPWMRMQRLSAGMTFEALPASAVPALLMDHKTAKYRGGGIIELKILKKDWRFAVDELRIEEGSTINAWFDANHPEEGVHLTNGRGQFLGHAMQTVRINVMRQDQMIDAAKVKQKAFSKELKNHRQITLTHEVLTARINDAQANLDTLDLARAALPAPVENPDETAAARITRATTTKAASLKPLSANLFGNARRNRGGIASPEIEV